MRNLIIKSGTNMDMNKAGYKQGHSMKMRGIIASVFTLFMMFVSNLMLSQELIPLAENNQWVYEEIVFESGEEISRDTLKFIIERPVKVNGKQWFISDYMGMKIRLRNMVSGHYVLDSAEIDAFGNFRQYVIYKNPRKTKTIMHLSKGGGIVSVSDQFYPVETPMNKFDCYKYELRFHIKEPYREDTYICPGIGMVFKEVEFDGRLMQMKLIEYKLH